MLLFDFDQVLVDTESIAHLRSSRAWGQYRRAVSNLDPCEGINEMLHFAASRGQTLAIVTQNPGFVPKLFVDKENWPIEIVVGWHDYRRPKPDPLCLLVAIQKAGARPDQVYHIGDLATDTDASRRAGVIAVGAGWAAVDKGALRQSRPDYYFATVKQLHAFIASL